jgi:hypothetical protein
MYNSDFDDIEDDDDEDEKIEVYVADFEWAPAIEKVAWDDPNLTEIVTSRLKGTTPEGFATEVRNWQKHINVLPVYDEIAIRKEIQNWDYGFPDDDNYEFGSFASVYARQVQYRTRLNYLISIVNAHYEMISQAEKTLKMISIKLCTGTAKDKESVATYAVHPFTIPATEAKRLLTYLDSVLKNIDFASIQMDRLLREHQALSRINNAFVNEGQSFSYAKGPTPLRTNINDSVEIKTRNNRLR